MINALNTKPLYATAFALLTLVSGCGGGGGDSSGTSVNTQSTASSPTTASSTVAVFPLQSAYKTLLSSSEKSSPSQITVEIPSTLTTEYRATSGGPISQTCSGTWSDSSSPGTSKQAFEGTQTNVVYKTYFYNTNVGCSDNGNQSFTYYYDENANLLGILEYTSATRSETVDDRKVFGYSVASGTQTALPVSVKRGDTGSYGAKMSVYSDSTKQKLVGTTTYSFVVEADGNSDSTAIISLISKDLNTDGTSLRTVERKYRINSAAKMYFVSENRILYDPNGSTKTFIIKAKNS